MDGIINVYKEKGFTSFDVVAILRKITGTKKTGHTGTLDPDAEGVLPVCIGKATKLADRLTDTDKQYKAVMLLGIRTDTQDITGRVIQSMSREDFYGRIDINTILSAFEHFTGDIMQIPPMYSAVKVGGVKLVDAARKGQQIERSPRKITVYGYSDISYDAENAEVSFTVSCSKGTYIRTLCEDIGNYLKIPACMKSLVRTMASSLVTDDARTIEQIRAFADEGRLSEILIPVDHMLKEYAPLTVKDASIKKIENGCRLYGDDIDGIIPKEPDAVYRMYDKDGNFYALYRYMPEQMCLKSDRMFI